MALFAPHETETLLAKLDARRQEVWTSYSLTLQGLDGLHYDLAERDAWAQLQVELRAIDAERNDVLSVTA